MVSAETYRLCARLHPFRILFRDYEDLRMFNLARGRLSALFLFQLLRLQMCCLQTGWGTRAGIGDPTAATNAASAASDSKISDEKLQADVQRYTDSPGRTNPAPFLQSDVGYAR